MGELHNLSDFRLSCSSCHGDLLPVNKLRVCHVHFKEANEGKSVLEVDGDGALAQICGHVVCAECYVNEHICCTDKERKPIPLFAILRSLSVGALSQELSTYVTKTSIDAALESLKKQFDNALKKCEEFLEFVGKATSTVEAELTRGHYSTLFDQFRFLVDDFTRYADGSRKQLEDLSQTSLSDLLQRAAAPPKDLPPPYEELSDVAVQNEPVPSEHRLDPPRTVEAFAQSDIKVTAQIENNINEFIFPYEKAKISELRQEIIQLFACSDEVAARLRIFQDNVLQNDPNEMLNEKSPYIIRYTERIELRTETYLGTKYIFVDKIEKVGNACYQLWHLGLDSCGRRYYWKDKELDNEKTWEENGITENSEIRCEYEILICTRDANWKTDYHFFWDKTTIGDVVNDFVQKNFLGTDLYLNGKRLEKELTIWSYKLPFGCLLEMK